jgi:NAD(P)H-dependent FMN reductase
LDLGIGDTFVQWAPPGISGEGLGMTNSSARDRILVFYGSYRKSRVGIRMADFATAELRARGADVELIDAREVGLPLLDRMYKEYEAGSAPQAMIDLSRKIRAADAFMFVVGEYNWGPQPGLKNLTDHFLEEWFWRPAAIVSYSPGRLSGARASSAWHPILSEMGMVVVSSTVAVGPIDETLDAQGEPVGEAGRLTQAAFARVADDLAWWTCAARNERLQRPPPY